MSSSVSSLSGEDMWIRFWIVKTFSYKTKLNVTFYFSKFRVTDKLEVAKYLIFNLSLEIYEKQGKMVGMTKHWKVVMDK